MKKTILFFILLFFIQIANAQSEFKIFGSDSNHEQISFKLINNLIVIPIEINGDKLSFILDTGVNKTILFNLTKNDSVGLLNTKKVSLRGLGKGKAVDALLSRNNTFKIKNIVSSNESLYVILKDYFDLSSKMGTTIHGIIGYSLLKDFVVRINYKTKKIDFYNPDTYTYSKCRKCETIPLLFYRKKPFVNAMVQLDTIGNKMTEVKMLIDSGGSDALWLFENSKENIKTPKRFFNDILGEGLSGTIFGNRSRIPQFKIGEFEIENPTVSFLDSASTHNARKFKQRNGSIGGNILKRFKVWIDYPNKKLVLKKNGSFKNGFNYNMSGLDVVYHGRQLVKEKVSQVFKTPYDRSTSDRNSVSFVTRYTFNFKPAYIIRKVLQNSAADKVGLMQGDIILSLNGKPSHEFTLNDIINRFQEKDRKKIRITVRRNGEKIKFEFRLEKKI
ncbi:aspartyl protease family protein [Polaribacter pectinis]|uniref:Aspartyl protease family protein n=1 Tax=Polaribacter pectinis TaxID=2738844 RepID=A0A7G9LD99_9FLAO|nr:aspartyl protease family protein [Polaribacter pectinis]QNM86598.1 aspartyl protease family protein [Polaribacter pectinis]